MRTLFFVAPEKGNADRLAEQISDECEFFSFSSARDCIKELSERSANNMEMPDVMIIDYNLSGINGLQLFKKLSPVLEDTKFIMMVSKEDDHVLMELIHMGLMNYVMKDANCVNALTTAVGKVSSSVLV